MQILAKQCHNKSFRDTTRQTLHKSNFKDWLRKKKLFVKKSFSLPYSSEGTLITGIIKINLCNVFIDLLAHHTHHDKWNNLISCYIFISSCWKLLDFVIKDKLFLIKSCPFTYLALQTNLKKCQTEIDWSIFSNVFFHNSSKYQYNISNIRASNSFIFIGYCIPQMFQSGKVKCR